MNVIVGIDSERFEEWRWRSVSETVKRLPASGGRGSLACANMGCALRGTTANFPWRAHVVGLLHQEWPRVLFCNYHHGL